MPNTRTKKPREKPEQVRFTKDQLRAIDSLVESGIYGNCRPDVIRFFVVQGLAEYDKQGRWSDKRS